MTDVSNEEEEWTAEDEAAWDAAPVEEQSTAEIAGEEKGLTGSSDQQRFRIEEDIARQVPVWKGVRSCSDEKRARDHLIPHYEAWVKKTIAKHQQSTAIQHGYHRATFWWQNKRVNGKRKCKGGWERVFVYVDFISD